MKLHEIRQEIRESMAEYWNYIPQGPLFNYNLGNSGDQAQVFGWHDARAVLEHDVDIALEFGMSDDPFDNKENWTEEWSQFPDNKIRAFYCDVFYRGALVDRVLLASVDGHRATLPLPARRPGGGWTVEDWPYQVARVVDDLHGHRDFEDYFRRSGIEKLPA
ncbi:hypothetical protein [Microbacterium sp.]|jgi:hypothetical protein|uniref:hypothetical protein n=1 Tax=Microbacterium sp. TaxID=51671 RepID=UPI0025E72E82|nr:hypothetical protein [Microbacterium sp.]MBT9608143.1 hypothetical protein [Microbacterium sp.]